MLNALRRLLEQFWVWLGGDLPPVETGGAVEAGSGQFLYVVRRGDTLKSVARRFGTSVWILADLNELDDFSLIRVGQRLLIPRPGASLPASTSPPEPGLEPLIESEAGPFIYIVQTGDTLSAIARRFGVTVAVIVETNHIRDPNLIRPGQRLLIPGPEPQPEPEPPPTPKPEPTPLPLPEPEPEPSPPVSPPPAPEPEPEPSPPVLEPEPSPPSAPEPEPEPSPPMPEPVPEPEPTPLPIPEPEPQPEHVYVVQPGDTLMAIARRLNVTVRAIIEANDIKDPNLIHPGQRLVIPGVSRPPRPVPVPEPTPPPEPEATPAPKPPLPSPIPWPDDTICGIYISYFAIGHEAHRHRVIDMLSKTEINTLVIDVKGDHGLVSYPTSVALAHDIGAARPTALDFDELMDFFKANSIYTIARIVTFKDNPFANAYPEWAAQREAGGLWHDREELAWAAPFVQSAWEYNADLAEEAARWGFDEIQFDYVRFPVHSQQGMPRFSQPLSREARVTAIAGFLSYVRGRLAPLGVRVAADVFGYTCWRQDDTVIGQDIERMAQYLDVLCPMLYPSSFGSGIPGYQYAIAYPYEIVYESVRRAVRRVEPLGCCVRPWIQDFPDYRFDKRVYGPAEIRAQMQGSFDGGGIGYMAWDPRIKYTTRAYLQNAIDMRLSDDYN
jgi:nucleoid-associated protein YgaU